MSAAVLTMDARGPWHWKIEFWGPDDEAIRACALDVPMFFRDGDGISIREMAEVYDDPSIPGEIRETYEWLRQSINEFLDDLTPFEIDSERITRRWLVEGFLYGSGLAHLTAKKRQVYERWRHNPVMLARMKNAFAITLAEFFSHVCHVRDLNLVVLGVMVRLWVNGEGVLIPSDASGSAAITAICEDLEIADCGGLALRRMADQTWVEQGDVLADLDELELVLRS